MAEITKANLQTISTVISICVALAAIAGSWYLLGYRMDQVEKRVESLELGVEETGKQITCQICAAHDIKVCPGC